MTKYGSADVGFLLVSGKNVLGDSTSLEDTDSMVLEETTVLGDAYEQHASVGVRTYTINQQGFYNDAAARSNEALIRLGEGSVPPNILAFAPEGNVIGRRFIGALIAIATYVRQISRGALHKANGSFVSRGGHDVGVILHALGAETAASGNTEGADSVDNGASSANGGMSHVHFQNVTLDGGTLFTVWIRHSADDITYADLVQAMQVSGDVTLGTAQALFVAGTIQRYLAHRWAFTGSGAGRTATYFVGFARR